MAVPTFTAQLGLPDPSAAPLTLTDLVNLLNALFLPISVNGFNAQIITGSATPGVGDQDKLWFRTDAGGNPLGFYVFNSGTWRPVYNGKIGQISMYIGDGSPFDGTGKGTIGGIWDGWAICNGLNGTPDMRDRFPVGFIEFSAGQAITNFEPPGFGKVSGGNTVSNYTIQQSDLPAYSPVYQGAEYDAGSSQVLNRIIIDNHWLNFPQTIPESSVGSGVHYGNTGGQTAIPIVPPYYCVVFVKFIGY